MTNRLLVVDNETKRKERLDTRYSNRGWSVETVALSKKSIKAVFEDDFDPHVVTLRIEGKPNKTISDIIEMDGHSDAIEWIFIVDCEDDIDDELLDIEHFNYVEKPFSEKRIDNAIQKALRASLTSRRLSSYSSSRFKTFQPEAYIGSSDSVIELRKMLVSLSEVPISTMIISGETGTGKGLVAKILHHIGMRSDGPLVELNCAALPRDLLESQLFGHEPGAFTGAKGRYRGFFEQADNGTLFLDEIGDMDIDLQAKVLKAIEDKKIRRLGSEREIEVDVQIIAASAKNLLKAADEKLFREDLYHRLSVFCVLLPPLRERKSDLLELAPRIIAEFNAIAGKRVEIIEDEVWEQLLDYEWPGNVRELRNVIERCVLMSSDEYLPANWLQLKSHCDSDETLENVEPIRGHHDNLTLKLDGSMALEEMDSHIIQQALEKNDFNITETARVLKTTRETIRYRIQKYSLKTSA